MVCIPMEREFTFRFLAPSCKPLFVHPLFEKANKLSSQVIGAAIEVLENGVSRLILPGANQTEAEGNDISF